MTDFQKRYLEEVGRRLHCQGFEVWPEYEEIGRASCRERVSS